MMNRKQLTKNHGRGSRYVFMLGIDLDDHDGDLEGTPNGDAAEDLITNPFAGRSVDPECVEEATGDGADCRPDKHEESRVLHLRQ